jgi:hypothetical protein
MKTFKTLSTLIILTFFVASCGDDETKVSPAKTKAAFNNVNTTLVNDLNDLQTSPGFMAIESLADLTSTSSPFGRLKSVKPKDVRGYLKTSVTSLRSVITNASSGNKRVSSSEPFDYNAKKGTYTWNAANQLWDKTEGTIIKIIFPTEGALSTNNNAEFQLTAYSETLFTDEWGTEYNPTTIEATLNVGGAKKAEIDLAAEYGDYGEPKLIDLYLFFDPFTIELNLDDKKPLASSISASLSKNSTTLIGFGVTVAYDDESKDEISIVKVTGYVQLLNVRFVANMTESEQTITIKVNGDTAGTVVFDEVTGEPLVRYTDGTTEPLSELFTSLQTEFEGLGM